MSSEIVVITVTNNSVVDIHVSSPNIINGKLVARFTNTFSVGETGTMQV